MGAPSRELLQSLFIRVCRESGFKLDSVTAATLVAKTLGVSPLEIWVAMPSLTVMDEIAAGTHPSQIVPVKHGHAKTDFAAQSGDKSAAPTSHQPTQGEAS
jgi:hypothetical protein